jgi:hypothetical protein
MHLVSDLLLVAEMGDRGEGLNEAGADPRLWQSRLDGVEAAYRSAGL